MLRVAMLALAGIAAVQGTAVLRKGLLRTNQAESPAVGAVATDHHDFDKGFEMADKDEKFGKDFQQHAEAAFTGPIHTTKAELFALLQKARAAMKEEFGKLEDTVQKRINGIFKIACPDVEAAEGSGAAIPECWIGVKVECQIFDVQDFVHTHRMKLTKYLMGKLNDLKTQFNAHLTTETAVHAGATEAVDFTKCGAHVKGACSGDDSEHLSAQCHCNMMHEINGILGSFTEPDDPLNTEAMPHDCFQLNEQDHATFVASSLDSQCKAFGDCRKGALECPKATMPPNKEDTCGDVVEDADAHKCSDKSRAYNLDDSSCLSGFLGMQGMAHYFGGADHSCGDEANGDFLACTSGRHKGRVGEMVDTAFECSITSIDGQGRSCSKEERAAKEGKCVIGACDCECICGGHQAESTVAHCASEKSVGSKYQPFPKAGDAATCGNTEWRQLNACPTNHAEA